MYIRNQSSDCYLSKFVVRLMRLSRMDQYQSIISECRGSPRLTWGSREAFELSRCPDQRFTHVSSIRCTVLGVL